MTAYECGAVVNPDTVTSQIEGGTVMALGGALFETVVFDQGRIARPSLAGYRVPRFADVPELEVVLLDRPDLPSAGRGRDAADRGGPGHRQRHLRGHRPAASLAAAHTHRGGAVTCPLT